ncbi:MAG: aspartate dehydrogenase [Lachnospiraceae bacterium]|nr:aspartate dehydrogenase [Lachnospiraceae bacterium]
MGLFKKKISPIEYDLELEYPALRKSICTGETVAGFKNKETNKFREVSLIRNDKDLESFKKAANVTDIKVEY